MQGPTQSRNAGRDPDRQKGRRTDRAEEANGHHGRVSGGGGGPAPGAGRGRRMSGAAAVEYAKAHLLDLTGGPCESVSSLSRTREGWRVVLEVLELERIPRTTDILASYQVELDEEGELMGYERISRYYRNEVSGSDQ